MSSSLAFTDPRRAWLANLREIGSGHGFFDRISKRHMGLFVDEGDQLMLSFDRADRIWDNGAAGLPLAFGCVPKLEFSFLSLLSIGRTWFRCARVDQMLESLAKDGFFASYSQVFLVATGPDCGAAALRAARHVPGAKVLLSRPWVEPAKADTLPPATVLFDPTDPVEAAHAAHFNTPGTTPIALPHAGAALDRTVARCEAMLPLTRHLSAGTLSARAAQDILAPLLRRDPSYLARLPQTQAHAQARSAGA